MTADPTAQNLLHHPFRSFSLWFFVIAMTLSWWAGKNAPEHAVVERVAMDEEQVQEIQLEKGEAIFISEAQSTLWVEQATYSGMEVGTEEWVATEDGESFYNLKLLFHRGAWSLFPALVTIVLCFASREPLTALFGGVLSGALLLKSYDIPGLVLIPGLAQPNAALVIVLYLCLLGGLLGIWSRNGAAAAFAELVTHHFVRGPKTAKLAAWFLGVFFFQGGTISTLLVGTTIKPVADLEKISHEELSYVVDSTASPIAILLPFNAWPFYVQSLIFIAGVPVLATEASRVSFFFQSIPLFFYAIFAVLFTFLLSLDKLPFISPTFKKAIRRARETGELNRPGSKPMQDEGETKIHVPAGYKPSAWEFIIPLSLIIGIAIGTFIVLDSPNVLWAFSIALAVAYITSRFRGMSLQQLMDGFTQGLQNVVYGAVVLLLAVIIGGLSREVGGGLFLVEFLGSSMPHVALPAILFLIAVVVAFATGTSWGTFAVTFPLAMPLAWEIAGQAGLDHPVLFLQICFAAVLNGSVFGDQCSPISDTTVLSSLATGCDLMDHVKTQIYPSIIAGTLAVICWTVVAFFA